MNLAAYRDAYGNSGEDLVDLAVCGMVNSYPDPFIYAPDHFPPLIMREAQKRVPARFPKPRPESRDELFRAAVA